VKLLIAITVGEAAGIGPEITIKTLGLEEIYHIHHSLVVSEGTTTHKTSELLKSPLKLHTIEQIVEVKSEFGTIDLLDLHNLNQTEVILGQRALLKPQKRRLS